MDISRDYRIDWGESVGGMQGFQGSHNPHNKQRNCVRIDRMLLEEPICF